MTGSTPLQRILGLALLPPGLRVILTAVLLLAALLSAFALRRRKRTLSPTTFVLVGSGLLLDVVSYSLPQADSSAADKVSAAAVVVFFFGIIRLGLEAIDAITRRGRSQFSTIFKDLIMFSLWGVVAGAVLYTDFGVQPLSILTTTTVVAAVVGLALQESLSNVFSGLMLQLSKPFEPGDWVRAGNTVGRVRGINWRSTTIITRANERLDIPNTTIGKDVIVNYAGDAITDELSVGISYDVAPNQVREVVRNILHDLPHVLRHPPPEVLPWEYGDSAIRYRIKWSIADYARQEEIHADVVSNLWYALRRHKMEIPFPMRTLQLRHDHSRAAEAEYERDVIHELRQVDFLRHLDDAAIRVLLPFVRQHQFGAGEVLIRQGEVGEMMYIIRHGKVEVIAHTNGGPERHVATVGSSRLVGESALYTSEPRNATVRAVTDVEVIELNREGFKSLFLEHPETAQAISDIVATRMTERQSALAEGIPEDDTRARSRWVFRKIREVLDF